MDAMERDDLERFIAVSQNNRRFDRYMKFPARAFSPFVHREEVQSEHSAGGVQYVDYVLGEPEHLRSIGVSTVTLAYRGKYAQVTDMPLLYYAACSMALKITRYCLETLTIDPNMHNGSRNGTVCEALASIAPWRLLRNLPQLYRTMQMLLEHDACPWSLIVCRAPLRDEQMLMGRLYPVYSDEDTRKSFDSLSHLYHSRYMFVSQFDVSTRMHRYSRCATSCITSNNFAYKLMDVRNVDCSSTSAMCVQFASNMNRRSRGLTLSSSTCADAIRTAARRDELRTPHVFPRPDVYCSLTDIEAGDPTSALYIVGKHAIILIKDDFIQKEKHSLLAMWHMGIRWPLAYHLRDLHRMDNTGGLCSFSQFMRCDWNVRSAFALRITAQWLSVQEPGYILMCDRKASTRAHWTEDETLHLPFVGFLDSEFRRAFRCVFRSNEALKVIVRLWFLKDIESEDQYGLARLHSFHQLPLEMLWYLLDSWWIEHLLCHCWRPGKFENQVSPLLSCFGTADMNREYSFTMRTAWHGQVAALEHNNIFSEKLITASTVESIDHRRCWYEYNVR